MEEKKDFTEKWDFVKYMMSYEPPPTPLSEKLMLFIAVLTWILGHVALAMH